MFLALDHRDLKRQRHNPCIIMNTIGSSKCTISRCRYTHGANTPSLFGTSCSNLFKSSCHFPTTTYLQLSSIELGELSSLPVIELIIVHPNPSSRQKRAALQPPRPAPTTAIFMASSCGMMGNDATHIGQ